MRMVLMDWKCIGEYGRGLSVLVYEMDGLTHRKAGREINRKLTL